MNDTLEIPEHIRKAAIERVEMGEGMNSVAYCQSADTKGTSA